MHARCETIDNRPTFAGGFAHARGILMVHTFNEGEELPNGKTKQWVITPQDGQPIAIAVICEKWNNGVEILEAFVQVTTPANELISRITDRMPAKPRRRCRIKALLRTFEAGGNWTMTEQPSNRRPRVSRPPRANPQQDLF